LKFSVKLFLWIFLIGCSAIASGFYFWQHPLKHSISNKQNKAHVNGQADENSFLGLQDHASSLKKYAIQHGFNTHYCMMIDMHIPSGKPRFFLYDFLKDSVLLAGLVTHGSGSDRGMDELLFSNEPNSNCTSLGKYKIGKSYYGKFGLAYKLYGLDVTNNQAYKRFVVLHAHECVPASSVYPTEICQSWGCPTVSPSFLSFISKYIDQSDTPLLLDIYY
jgi:hypothetical protein